MHRFHFNFKVTLINTQCSQLFWIYQTVALSCPFTAGGTAGAMNIFVWLSREVHIDNMGNIGNIQASCRQVGGYQNFNLASAELVHSFLPFFFVYNAMQAVCANFVVIELIHQKIQLRSVIHKNQDAFCFFIQGMQQFTQEYKFIPLFTNEIKMLNVRIHLHFGFADNLHRVVHMIFQQF